uniref:Uncharacterized protein n=1 Tax=Vespula pensylvanica TaxID=30213 RepID=A0A834UHA3_VESPE|nr:hypothetical protein H0235_001490 [Vespula pensylvanica]
MRIRMVLNDDGTHDDLGVGGVGTRPAASSTAGNDLLTPQISNQRYRSYRSQPCRTLSSNYARRRITEMKEGEERRIESRRRKEGRYRVYMQEA